MSLLQVQKFRGKTGDTMADKNYLHTAYAKSADGTNGFTTVYPNLNLLDGTSNHTIKGTMIYSGKLSDEDSNSLLAIFKGLEGQIVTVSIDYEYSGFIAGSGNNRIGWATEIDADTTVYPEMFYYPENDSGSGRLTSTFVVPKNISHIEYMGGFINFSGSGTGTLSHFKLEKGSVATSYMPSASEATTADWPKYVGTYVDTNPVSSTDPSKYVWDEMKYRVYLDGVPVGGSKLLSAKVEKLKPDTSYTIQVKQVSKEEESDFSDSVTFKTNVQK